jgi:hypothetical protein
MQAQADENLGRFMDYCTYGHMIDNVVLIVTGTLHERDVQVWACVAGCGHVVTLGPCPCTMHQVTLLVATLACI